MTVLSPPRHPIVADALALARDWCAGHIIDGAPALAHAARVAAVLVRHIQDAPAELVAAALLHDAPEFAPADVDLDDMLGQLGAEVVRVVRTLQREHLGLAFGGPPEISTEDGQVLSVSAADKLVSLSSILGRAARSGDAAAFWAMRARFLNLVPYLRRFHITATPCLPDSMAAQLDDLITLAERIPR
jgi:(p)ppGpp synthase/HD superfamily hydrolase